MPVLFSAACLLGLLGLGVTLGRFRAPTPLAFMLFMTVGQGSLVAAMGLGAVVIVRELRRKRVL